LSGARGRAIRSEAVDDQLGVDVAEVKPIGSKRRRVRRRCGLFTVDRDTRGDIGPVLFAKLLARSHPPFRSLVQARPHAAVDRLEDEGKFQTVRRLVQQRDYLGLRIAEAGIHVPKTFGVVELTAGAVPARDRFPGWLSEIGDADLSTAAIDSALGVIRKLWDAGLAPRHQAGQLDGEGDDVALIDVSFGEIRPSPWRQTVDLAKHHARSCAAH
jgi:hypothetical protein